MKELCVFESFFFKLLTNDNMNSNNFASNFMSVRMNQVIFSLNIKTD